MSPTDRGVARGADRIAFLDGLRGVAIGWVLLYHAYVRWPEIVPFGNAFSGVPLLSYGWLGVELFFLISGFVIFMTLEKSAGFADFIKRRWLRLFPAMLVCSILVFATASMFPERPQGMPAWRDLLPGLTFIDPLWFNLFANTPQGVLEGAFWSLFVEAKFYLVAGALFFLIGGGRMIAALLGIFLAARAVMFAPGMFPGTDFDFALMLVDLASAKYFGWFAAGCLYYLYFRHRKPGALIAAVLVSLACALVQDGHQKYLAFITALVGLVFTAAMVSSLVQRLLSLRPLLMLGFASYPLYLLHENLMVASIAKLGALATGIPNWLLPVGPILLVISLGYLVARFVEPPLRRALRRSFGWEVEPAPRPDTPAPAGPLPGARGFLTFAYGSERYLKMAEALARSMRLRNPSVRLAVVTDSGSERLQGLFDDVIAMRPELGPGVMQKLHADQYSPYQQTIFVDSDCLAFSDPERLWDLYAGARGFGVKGWAYTQGGETHYAMDDVAATLQKAGAARLGLFNSGLFYFDRSAEARAVFESAREIGARAPELGLRAFKGAPCADEPVFGLALERQGIDMLPWDDGEAMCTATASDAAGLAAMNVATGHVSLLRYGVVTRPVILHFHFEAQDSFEYFREMQRLRLGPGFRAGPMAGLLAVPQAIAAKVRYLRARIRQRLRERGLAGLIPQRLERIWGFRA